MTSVTEQNHIDRSRPGRAKRTGLGLAVAAVALLAAGCSSGPGSQEDLVNVLVDTGNLSETEASCVADAIFDEYETDEDALGTISAAPDFEFLGTEEGVPGFPEFFDQTVQRCAAVGPTTG